MKTIKQIVTAASRADWRQVALNGGPPCFHLQEDGSFCLRAERWAGHQCGQVHCFVTLAKLLNSVVRAAIAACAEAIEEIAAEHQVLGERFQATLGVGDDLDGPASREFDIAEIIRALAARLEGAAGIAAAKPKQDEIVLRRLLWLRHGCPSEALYSDDGEMSCGSCGIDFRRWPAQQIEEAFAAIGRRKLEIADPDPASGPPIPHYHYSGQPGLRGPACYKADCSADDALCPGSESYSPGSMCVVPCPECGKKVQRFRQKLQRHRRPAEQEGGNG